jgi:hypothetical protein
VIAHLTRYAACPECRKRANTGLRCPWTCECACHPTWKRTDAQGNPAQTCQYVARVTPMTAPLTREEVAADVRYVLHVLRLHHPGPSDCPRRFDSLLATDSAHRAQHEADARTIAELRGLLKEAGSWCAGHKHSCREYSVGGGACDCGRDAIRARIAEATG